MIKHEQELRVMQRHIEYFQHQLAWLRAVERIPANYRCLMSGYLTELDRMMLEVREYFWLHPVELADATRAA